MNRLPQVAMLADGKRLHLQDGPIDLIVEAAGRPGDVRVAYQAAIERFTGLLDELCAELEQLRQPARPDHCMLNGPVARRMHRAVAPYAADSFITPMAAVAGAVAEEILQAMCGTAALDRAYVNNGGDIALHLSADQTFSIGVLDRPDAGGVLFPVRVSGQEAVRGVATSGRHGRSFSFGIADSVTVLSSTAAQADAAASIIANAVDLPGHPKISRVPACDIQPDSDLGARLVTRAVGDLRQDEVMRALASGRARAERLLGAALIDRAILRLAGETVLVKGRVAGRARGATDEFAEMMHA